MKKEYRTKCRDEIQNFLSRHKDKRFSAAEIYEQVKEKCERISKTTVYRNLDKLTEQGLLIKAKSSNDDRCYYQCVTDKYECEKHLHMQCTKCGRIYHLDCEFMCKFYKHILDSHSFNLDLKNSVLTGTCVSCSK